MMILSPGELAWPLRNDTPDRIDRRIGQPFAISTPEPGVHSCISNA
jgi:hypothetical protein